MTPPQSDPGRVILWLLAIILFIVVLVLIFNLLDVSID